MNIRLDKLKRRPQQVVFDELAAAFPELSGMNEPGGVAFASSIKGRFTAAWAGSLVEVSGRIETDVLLPCSRCLESVERHCEIDVHLSYAPDRQAPDDETLAERELDQEDLGLLPVTGEEIDLRQEIAQEVIMALPQHVLCRQDCSGLCPVCGANRNQLQCSCEKPVFHTGLLALKGLNLKN